MTVYSFILPADPILVQIVTQPYGRFPATCGRAGYNNLRNCKMADFPKNHYLSYHIFDIKRLIDTGGISMISEFEKQQRIKGYEYAKASVRFEGGCISTAFDRQCQRYINGEIGLEDLDRYIDTRQKRTNTKA